MSKSFGIVFAFSLLFVSSPLLAHGGGLDRNGCHTNRKTGDYHCHGGGLSTPPPSAPLHAVQPAPAPGATHKDLVRAAQTLLQMLHFDVSLQGELDTRTRAAITQFQRGEGLEPDGAVSTSLVLRLAHAVAKRCR